MQNRETGINTIIMKKKEYKEPWVECVVVRLESTIASPQLEKPEPGGDVDPWAVGAHLDDLFSTI